MGNCDLCNTGLSTSDGYLFTTKELVVNQEFWKRRLSLYSSLFKMLPTREDRVLAFLDTVHDACASKTPWLLCEECSKVSSGRESAKSDAQRLAKTGTIPAKYSGDLSLCAIREGAGSTQRIVQVRDAEGHAEAMKLAMLACESHYGKVEGIASLGQSNATGSSSGNSGCFIATAACGSICAPDVLILQNYRDKYLLLNPFGQWLFRQYYRVSPRLAKLIRRSLIMRLIVRYSIIKPLVFIVKVSTCNRFNES